MRTLPTPLLLGSIILLSSTTLSNAADVYGTPLPGGLKDGAMEQVIQVPAPIPVQETARWYLRGDIAYGFQGDPDTSIDSVGTTTTVTGDEIESITTFGFGAGYYFTPSLRADITLDYRVESDVTANYVGSLGGGGVLDGSEFTNLTLESMVTMANLYYEFRAGEHFSPYIGGGIGVSFNELRTESAGNITVKDGTTTQFSASLMAGLSVRLSDGWIMDAGYRWLHTGDAVMNFDLAVGGGIQDHDLVIGSMSAHEIRIGMRYDLF